MADIRKIAEKQRREYANAWQETMIKIWRERIIKLGVYDTGALYRSVFRDSLWLNPDATEMMISEVYLEYGLWQELGVGREVPHGNPGDIGRAKKRERRKWMYPKYYGSTMAMKEFLADNIGREFVGLVSDAFDTDRLRAESSFYKRMNY